MSDLVFTTQGQAETLAAQEAVAKKGREIKEEFEAGAKSVGAWDSAMSKLKSSAETALRSVATEQEKIAQQIDKISQAQEKGLIPPAEAEAAVTRLKERWLEADEATKKQAEDAEKAAKSHELLKESAEHAIESVASESEKTEKKIEELGAEAAKVREAMKEGLVPPEVGEKTIKRLKDRMEELKKPIVELKEPMEEVAEGGNRIEHAFKHLFDPITLIKAGGAFFSIHAAIHAIEEELEDIQHRVDQRAELLMKPAERQKFLDSKAEDARNEEQEATARAAAAERGFGPAAEADKKAREEKQREIDDLDRQHKLDTEDANQASKDAVKKSAEDLRRYHEQQADDATHVKRAHDNWLRNPGSPGSKNELDDAREHQRKHQEDYDRQLKEDLDANLKRMQSHDRREDEYKRNRERQSKELNEPDQQTNAAMVAAAEANSARERAIAARQAAEAASAENKTRPETQISEDINKFDEKLDRLGEKIAAHAYQAGELNSKQIEKFSGDMGSLGFKPGGFQLPFGRTVAPSFKTREEAVKAFEWIHENLAHPHTGGGLSTAQKSQERELTPAEEKQLEFLDGILKELRSMQTNGGMTGGPE